MLQHKGTGLLETKRLYLRRFSLADAGDMIENWISDPVIQGNYGEPVYDSLPEVENLLREWLRRYEEDGFYRWAVVLKETGVNIGQTAYCKVYDEVAIAEIEYCIGQGYWGLGYAGEALEAIIDFGLTVPCFQRLEAFHRAENVNSARVLEKSTMRRVDTVERFRRENKMPLGEVCYAAAKAMLSP